MPDQTLSNAAQPLPPAAGSFQLIENIVVLMLENRSFDHLFGFLNTLDPRVVGLSGNEFNYDDPNAPQPGQVRKVYRADSFDMPFDPPHEFVDVQMQLYGPSQSRPDVPNAPSDPAPMNGFVYRALAAVPNIYAEDAARVMSCFYPDQIPILRTLAQEFALFNSWHSSLPGPTWPNRFFVHAATSGGLNYSPSDLQIIAGFSFKNGTIYDRLTDANLDWHIYHDGLPQCIGIGDLRWNYVKQQANPFDSNFRPMAEFEADIAAGDLPPFTFIEPNYDTGNSYLGGNSMHPLNDIRKGEALVKRVYEALRGSAYWGKVMLIVTFDEHGGFFDHVSPPHSIPTGDDHRYANTDIPFAFDRLGVRVPALVISAYTQRGTVIGSGSAGDPNVFDHSSIPATVEKRFGLPSMTQRDANARTLDVAINTAVPRVAPADAPMTLPDPAPDGAAAVPVSIAQASARDHAPLSDNQKTFVALALACDLEVSDPSQQQALRERYNNITRQKDAADYINEVAQKFSPPQPPRP